MTTTTRPKAECPYCHTIKSVRKDGTFQVHGQWDKRCYGSHKPVPKEEIVNEE